MFLFLIQFQDIFGGLFARTELSEVLTEIVKMDPNFCKEQFLKVSKLSTAFAALDSTSLTPRKLIFFFHLGL